MRTIANSRTYQAGIATNEWNAKDRDNFSHAIPRRLDGGAVDGCADARDRRPARIARCSAGHEGRRSSSIRTSARKDFSICSAGPRASRPASASGARDLSLPQALNLVNGKTISDAVADANGRVAKAVLRGAADEAARRRAVSGVAEPPADRGRTGDRG